MSARPLVVALVGLLLGGCAMPVHLAVERMGQDVQWEFYRTWKPVLDAGWRIQLCASIRGDTVAFSEERALGDALGVKVAAAKGGLALTYVPAPFMEVRGPGAVTLASPDATNDRARAVAVVGAGLARHGGRPEIPWRFGVLASDEVNAVSAPGGLVLVTRGALAAVQTEDALAGILAHEVAHVVQRHALDRYATEKRNACFGALAVSGAAQDARPPGDASRKDVESARRLFGDDVSLSISEGGTLDLDDGRRRELLDALSTKAVEWLYAQGLDRPAELAADALAVDLLLAAGYQPEEFIRFVGTLPDNGNFFSHHPSPQDRVDEMMGHLERRRAEEDPLRPTPRAAPVPLPRALARTGN